LLSSPSSAAWEKLFPYETSLPGTFKSKLSGALEEAFLLLTSDPIDAFSEKLKRVRRRR
jgi:hypothetical protein